MASKVELHKIGMARSQTYGKDQAINANQLVKLGAYLSCDIDNLTDCVIDELEKVE